MYCTVSSSQRLNQKTSLITVDIFVLDRQRHTYTENISLPQIFSTAANIQQDLHHILKYIPKDSLHCSNMYQTDTTISCVPFVDSDSGRSHCKCGIKRISRFPAALKSRSSRVWKGFTDRTRERCWAVLSAKL